MARRKRTSPGAIALDTSILEQYKFSFDVGLLKRLEQFSGTDIKVLFPDVVISESAQHLSEHLVASRSALSKAIKGTSNSWGTTKKARDKAYDLLVTDADPGEVAKGRIGDFINAVDGLVLECGAIKGVNDVIDRYFAARPPFGEGSKKAEFPDAFALAALSEWGEKNCDVIVVSADRGWIDYCAERSELTGVGSLSDALEIFQEESADYLGSRFLDFLKEGRLDFAVELERALDDQSHKIDVSVMVDSQFYVEDEISSVSLTLCEDALSAIDDVNVVELTQSECVISVEVAVHVVVEIEASFLKWDSIDREYMPMGSATLTSEEEDQASLLVSCSLGSSGDIKRITRIELQPMGHSIEFDDAEPDWMSEREHEHEE